MRRRIVNVIGFALIVGAAVAAMLGMQAQERREEALRRAQEEAFWQKATGGGR